MWTFDICFKNEHRKRIDFKKYVQVQVETFNLTPGSEMHIPKYNQNDKIIQETLLGMDWRNKKELPYFEGLKGPGSREYCLMTVTFFNLHFVWSA